MTTRRPYPTYKDSGIAWLGEIPAHWVPHQLKYSLVKNDGGVWGEDFDENGTIVLRSTEIALDGSWNIKNPARRKLSQSERNLAWLRSGDLLITKSSGSESHLGKTAIVSNEIEQLGCAFSNFMQRLRLSNNNDSKYVFYFLNGEIGKEQLGYYGSTTTGLRNLSGNIIGRVMLPGPPLPEQRTIAAFLDRETGRIDALIAKKQRLIELLQEKRTAIISHAVTKGLDPDAPMKDSGVEWIGEIPAHWRIARSKRFFTVRTERVRPDDEQLSATQAYGVISQKEYMRLEGRKVTQITRHLDKRRHVEIDDFVISMRSFQGGLERAWTTGCIRSSYVVLRPSPQINVDFFAYLFKSYRYIQALRATSNFIRDGQDLNFSNFSFVDLPVIPRYEQKEIAAFLDKEVQKIDTLVEKSARFIELLQEYRTALISAAVTGKIDVRNLQP